MRTATLYAVERRRPGQAVARQRSAASSGVAFGRRASGDLEMSQVAERLLQPPRGVAGRRRRPVHAGHGLEGADRTVGAQDLEQPLQPLGHERAVGLDVRADVGERAPVAGQAEPRPEHLDALQRGQELADRVGRVAVVVVERHAAEQVVAADQQPPFGLEQADVRGRVARRLDDQPGPEVAADLDAGQQRPVRLDQRGQARALVAAALRPGLQRRLGHAALARHLQARGERRVGVLRGARHVAVVRMHPQLATRPLDDRRRLAVVVDVRVGADEQPHVLEPQADLLERALEVGQRAGLVQTAVEQHDAVAGGDRPGVAVRDAGPRERQAQAPHAGQHALAAADLAPVRPGGHRGAHDTPLEAA